MLQTECQKYLQQGWGEVMELVELYFFKAQCSSLSPRVTQRALWYSFGSVTIPSISYLDTFTDDHLTTWKICHQTTCGPHSFYQKKIVSDQIWWVSHTFTWDLSKYFEDTSYTNKNIAWSWKIYCTIIIRRERLVNRNSKF